MTQSAVIHEDFEFKGHNAILNAVCYNRHHDCFVSTDDACLRLWGMDSRHPEQRYVALPARTSAFIQAIAYIDTRQIYVAAALDGTLKLYDDFLNEIASVCTGRGAILSMVFDSKHNRLLTGGIDGCAAWQVRGRPLVTADSVINTNYELAALPHFFHRVSDPRRVSSTTTSSVDAGNSSAPHHQQQSSSGSPRRRSHSSPSKATLNAPRRRPIAPNELSWIQNMQLSSDQTRLYAQGKHSIDVFSAVDGHHLDTYADLFPRENGAITAFIMHEKTQYIVCGCINGVIFVLSLHPTTLVHTFKDHTTTVTSLAVHLSSGLIFSSSLDGTVRLWDLEARRQAHRLDVRQPVHGMAIMTPSANPCRFYCRIRSIVRLYSVKSAAKEHLASLSPMSVLQRVLLPSAPTTQYHDPILGSQDGTSPPPVDLLSKATRNRVHHHRQKTETENEAAAAVAIPLESEAPNDLTVVPQQAQWIVAAGMDKTIRLFAGRAPHEAPSFTWIPEENALDLTGFALHPVRQRLFLLLESQKILVVRATTSSSRTNSDRSNKHADDDGDDDSATDRQVERVVDVNAVPTTGHASLSGQKRFSLDNVSTVAAPQSPPSATQNPASNPLIRGAVLSICCCYYPPLFRAPGSHSQSHSDGSEDDGGRHVKWFSRTFVHRRQQSRRDLKRVDDLAATSTTDRRSTSSSESPPQPPQPHALVPSDREWIVCGSEFGHLVFWHSGLTNSFHEAISLDAHDAAVVALAASASSPLLVSLDAAKRVHVWRLQPAFTLRHVVELSEQPTCFALAPCSEIVLTGYEDGAVVLLHAGDANERLETFAGSEDNHFAMVGAGDFLDAKAVVVTASVDAVIKVWDQQRTLLRQLQTAMAVTSLCFMNDLGDMMAGVASGIVVLSRNDVLPDKLPTVVVTAPAKATTTEQQSIPSSSSSSSGAATATATRPFWLPSEQSEKVKESEKPGDAEPQKLARTTSVRFQLPTGDDGGASHSPDKHEGSARAAERVADPTTKPPASTSMPTTPQDGPEVTPRRPTTLTLNPLDRVVTLPPALLSPPVLRQSKRSTAATSSSSRAQPSNQSSSRPSSHSNETTDERPDPDWREIVMYVDAPSLFLSFFLSVVTLRHCAGRWRRTKS
ncbi:hypothetical protein PINS_up005536 [Pythium insidiosum]|nr:hypothetical protein PINS_up005536 [Pythium insidiosum]